MRSVTFDGNSFNFVVRLFVVSGLNSVLVMARVLLFQLARLVLPLFNIKKESLASFTIYLMRS